jgi:DNA-binding CsgD family transcriptional regulator
MHLPDPFDFHNPLVCLGKFLEEFVHSQHLPAEVKEAKSGRYIMNNKAVADLSGLTPEERIGLTIYDLGKINKLPEETVNKVVKIDQEVYKEQLFVRDTIIFYKQAKTVYLEEIVKKPVLDHNNKVVAIFCYSRDLSSNVNPLFLFKCYQDLYHNALNQPKSAAIKPLLQHLRLDTCFIEIPTEQELITLLTMRKTMKSKYVAQEMDVKPRTIEEYKSRLRAKLKVIGLDEIVMQLRVHNEYETIDR